MAQLPTCTEYQSSPDKVRVVRELETDRLRTQTHRLRDTYIRLRVERRQEAVRLGLLEEIVPRTESVTRDIDAAAIRILLFDTLIAEARHALRESLILDGVVR